MVSLKAKRYIGAGIAGLMLFGATPAAASFSGTNGRLLIIKSSGADLAGVYSLKSDGSNLFAVNSDFAIANTMRAAYSPDGTKIAYTKDTGTELDIYVANADGSNPVDITSGAFDFAPVWSPDGTKLAFVRNDSNGDYIWTVDISTLATTQLTNATSVLDNSPSWSPDGSTVAFVRDTNDIDTVDATGPAESGLTTVFTATTPIETNGIDYSPDGTKIAYSAQFGSNGTDDAIHSVVVSSGVDSVLVNGGDDYYKQSPTYSPDGTKLAYSTSDTTNSADDHSRIFVANADGTSAVAIYDSGAQASQNYGGAVYGVMWGTDQNSYTVPPTSSSPSPDATGATLPKAGGIREELSRLLLAALAATGIGLAMYVGTEVVHRRKTW